MKEPQRAIYVSTLAICLTIVACTGWVTGAISEHALGIRNDIVEAISDISLDTTDLEAVSDKMLDHLIDIESNTDGIEANTDRANDLLFDIWLE